MIIFFINSFVFFFIFNFTFELFICSPRPVRLVGLMDEPSFFQLVDKTQIDKILYLGLAGLRINDAWISKVSRPSSVG